MNITQELSKAELDRIMSGIGMYDYYLEEDFGDWIGIADRRRIPKGYYCELGRSTWTNTHHGATSYMIDPIYVEKKSNPPGPVVKNTINIKHSQVVYSPHSIQRFIQRGNKMPKLVDLHRNLPICWQVSNQTHGVSDIMLPVDNGAFLGNLHYAPGFIYDIFMGNTKKGLHIDSMNPTVNKQGEVYMRPGNHAEHHIFVPGQGIRHMSFHAETYVDYDSMNTQKKAIYDLHYYDPEASWNLQVARDNKRYYSSPYQSDLISMFK